MSEKKLDKTIYNEFEQELIDNGYVIYHDSWKKAIRLIQKKIKDEKGVKYFINVYHYNFGKQYPGKAEENDSYMFSAQFTNEEKNHLANVDFSSDFIPNKYDNPISTLEQVEEFYEKIFLNFNFDYYEKEDNI